MYRDDLRSQPTRAPAATTIPGGSVDGKVVVRRGNLATIDLGPQVERHNRLARELARG